MKLSLISVATCVVLPISVFSSIFTFHPKDVTTFRDFRATFKCAVEKPFTGNLYWFKGESITDYGLVANNTVVQNNYDKSRLIVIRSDNTKKGVFYVMTIYNTRFSDSGGYFCAVKNNSTTPWEMTSIANVTVVDDPDLQCSFYPDSPGVGDRVTFTCSIEQSLITVPVDLIWRRSSFPQLSYAEAINLPFGGCERGLSPGRNCSVNWTITAIDNFQNFTCSIAKTNRPGCSIMPLQLPSTSEVQCSFYPSSPGVGDNVIFTCSIGQSLITEPIDLTWTRSSVPIPQLSCEKAMDSTFGGCKRSVLPGLNYSINWTTTVIDNFQSFTCSVANTSSSGCSIIPLQVPPTPDIFPRSISRNAGEHAKFSCVSKLTHPSVANYTWSISKSSGDNEITSTTDRFEVVYQGNTLLLIKNLTLADNGTSIGCRATNQFGITAEVPLRSIVYVMPRPLPNDLPDNDIATTTIIGSASGGAAVLIVVFVLLAYFAKQKLDENEWVIVGLSRINTQHPNHRTETPSVNGNIGEGSGADISSSRIDSYHHYESVV